MPIAVTCPACLKRFAAPDALSGKRAKCSACGGVLVVPAPAPQQVAVVQPVAPQVVVVKPVVQSRPQVAVVKPVVQSRPQVAVAKPAPQPRSQPAGGNSLLDLLEQADLSAPQGQGAFGASGGAFPPGRATVGRPYARKSIWTSPVLIGLAVTGLVAIVGGGIAAAVLLAPADDESESTHRVAAAVPPYGSVGAPAGSSAAGQAVPNAFPLAEAAPMTEYERGLREVMDLMRQSADQMVAIVDRATAVDGFPKLIEYGGKLMSLGNKLQRMERHGQLTARDAQLSHEFEPEANRLIARINAEKPRLEALATQLQMENNFARFSQVGVGPSPGQQQPQFVPQQPQPPMMNQQPGVGPRQHGPRNNFVPRH